jgi:hypothetical protein
MGIGCLNVSACCAFVRMRARITEKKLFGRGLRMSSLHSGDVMYSVSSLSFTLALSRAGPNELTSTCLRSPENVQSML